MTVKVRKITGDNAATLRKYELGEVTPTTVTFEVQFAYEAADLVDAKMQEIAAASPKGGHDRDYQSLSSIRRALRDPEAKRLVISTAPEQPASELIEEPVRTDEFNNGTNAEGLTEEEVITKELAVTTIEQAVAESEAVATYDEARSRADNIKRGLEDFVGVTLPTIQTAWRKGDYKALGYPSWEVYLHDEFGPLMKRLGKDESRETIAVLSAFGMSSRAIAPIVGVNQSTVVREQQKLGDANASVTGLDGRVTKKPKKEPKPVDAETEDLFVCALCEKSKGVSELNEIDDKNYCQSCADKLDGVEDLVVSDTRTGRTDLDLIGKVLLPLSKSAGLAKSIDALDDSVTPEDAVKLIKEMDEYVKVLNVVRKALRERKGEK